MMEVWESIYSTTLSPFRENNNYLKSIQSILSFERMQILILTSEAYNRIRDVYNQNHVF